MRNGTVLKKGTRLTICGYTDNNLDEIIRRCGNSAWRWEGELCSLSQHRDCRKSSIVGCKDERKCHKVSLIIIESHNKKKAVE